MIARLIEVPSDDARQQPRTSLFVMAALYSAFGSAPVKVRDMSSTGALIEGGVVPPAGTKILLSRGSLEVAGEIVWSREGRAGLRFDSHVSVREWLPRQRPSSPQQKVDETVQRIKTDLAWNSGRSELPPSNSNRVSVLQLVQLRTAIETLADDLVADPEVVRRHATKLQTLDLVAQLLTKLAAQNQDA